MKINLKKVENHKIFTSEKTEIEISISVKFNNGEYILCTSIKISITILVEQWLACWLLSVVDCGFEPCSGQTKDNKTGISCFSVQHTVLRSKSKDLVGSESGHGVWVE